MMTGRLRFHLGRLRATGRIAADYLHSALRPVRRQPEGWPTAAEMARSGAALKPLPARFRLLSWNIHRGYRLAAVRTSLERIVGEHGPHILLLQEVPVRAGEPIWEREGIRDLLAGWDLHFAPMHRVLRPSSYYPFAASGQLTAARAPVRGSEVWPLPTVSRAKLGRRHEVQRIALAVTLATAAGDATVWNLHLENTTTPAGRVVQVGSLLARIERGARRPTVVAGDFNTLLDSLEGAAGLLAEVGFARLEVVGRRYLRPAIDHVFVRDMRALAGRELAARGSDHRPILAEVEIIDTP